MNDNPKSNMSPDERSRRRIAMGQAASEKVSKSEQLNFRLEEKSILQLQKLANKEGIALGTMIRNWVIERMSQEESETAELSGKACLALRDMRDTINELLGDAVSTKAPATSKISRDFYETTYNTLLKHYASNSSIRHLTEVWKLKRHDLGVQTAAFASLGLSMPNQLIASCIMSNFREREKVEELNKREQFLSQQLEKVRKEKALLNSPFGELYELSFQNDWKLTSTE